jgi:hypothetical protein
VTLWNFSRSSYHAVKITTMGEFANLISPLKDKIKIELTNVAPPRNG